MTKGEFTDSYGVKQRQMAKTMQKTMLEMEAVTFSVHCAH
jgi:hypothetical protein